MTPRVVIGITGASGAALGVRMVELLAESGACELHLVVSRAAERTLAHECGASTLPRIAAMAARHHPIEDIGAAIASGSFRTAGMIIAPCSMRTLAAIAFTAADNLLVRAADVTLKERRPLVLLARESPLHLGHLRAMVAVTEMGGIVAPPVPSFYRHPQGVAEIIDHIARRTIGQLGINELVELEEWEGEPATRQTGPMPRLQP